MLTLFSNAANAGNTTAILSNEKLYTYNELLNASKAFAGILLQNKNDLHESRVCFMVTPGFDYVKVQWAIWQAGGIAVPLCLSHPLPSLQYVIEDTEATVVGGITTIRRIIKGINN